MNRRTFAMSLAGIFALGLVLRTLWLTSDPPVAHPVGIVWHDEGAWVHNARNRALWGVWRTDDWNPVFVSPVFTALEYGAFSTLGVGLWQARVVPVLSGLATMLCVVVGLHALAGRKAAAIGGVLVATSYALIMWNRAALMESTMTAWIAAGWAATALASRRPAWAAAAGACAVLAWFTKAAAAFFVAAVVLNAALTLLARARPAGADGSGDRRVALFTIAGLAIAAAAFLAIFVVPHWTEYRFYNWQMSVTRKPEYSIGALADRASWLPIVPSTFSQMWIVLAGAIAALAAVIARWRAARPAERLLVLWVLVGLAELVVHDSGNERRYVMFIPAMAALGALALAADRPLFPRDVAAAGRWRLLAATPVMLALAYLLAGSLLRPLFLDRIESGDFRTIVRLSAGLAAAATVWLLWSWRRVARRLSEWTPPAAVLSACVAIAVTANLSRYADWAAQRASKNYHAAVDLGRILAPGTLVQGKLANGLALENGIRPLFVGNGFGNYDDRLQRPDARYILTYDLPRIGYESSDGSDLIQDLLDHYPSRRVVATFEVDETPDADRAALIDKFPDAVRIDARD